MSLRRPPVRPVISREAYTLQQISQVFPGGEWVDGVQEEDPSEADDLENSDEAGCDSRPLPPPSVALIGGPKYDVESVQAYLSSLPAGTKVYVGAGKGVEADLRNAEDCSVQVVAVDLEPDLFGKKARDLNVPQVLIQDISSPVVLVGAGTRVKQARSWLKTVDGLRDPENRREVVEL